MTPEQKELKIEAYAEALRNPDQRELQLKRLDSDEDWKTDYIRINHWMDDNVLIRLAPPAEIPWHNPEGVTQEQLEPEKGWRFFVEEELDGRFTTPENRKIGTVQYRHGSGWVSGVNGLTAAERICTYRIKDEPLPKKYQHLVPESEEARAMRLFADLKAPEGYGEPEFLGSGPVGIEDGFMYAGLIKSSLTPAWQWQHFLNGRAPSCFCARARKLPTEKEKAEAALNAYKLEPGERLVHRGYKWNSSRSRCNFLYVERDFPVTRHDNRPASGGPGYYAEIIKEPEIVPFTQETFPEGNVILRDARYGPYATTRHAVHSFKSGLLVAEYSGDTKYIPWKTLFEQWEICTDGTTWTRAGKGVGA